VRRDEYGPKWPLSVAPWQVHLNALRLNVEEVNTTAEKLYAELQDAGIEVVYDDRDERPGVQFADADLLGVPIRLIVSERNLKNSQIEFKRRDTGESGVIPLERAAQTIRDWIDGTLAAIKTAAEDISAS